MAIPVWMLISDISFKVFDIPAPDPGATVGFEYTAEENPLDLQDIWTVQDDRASEHQVCPSVERRYTLNFRPVGVSNPHGLITRPGTCPRQ